MQKTDESYFLDAKLLNNLKQSTQLQSQLKVFLYKDIDIVASKNNIPLTSNTPTLSSGPINESLTLSNNSKSSRKGKKHLHQPLNQLQNLNDKELQDYLQMILKFYQRSENHIIISSIKYFLQDSANFFIIENSLKNRQQKINKIQQQARQNRFRYER